MVNNRIRILRKEMGLTQAELGDKLNVIKQTISSWETGVSNPSNDALLAMSKIFGVSVDYLLGIDHPENMSVLDLQSDADQLTPKEKSLLQAFNQCSDECQNYLIAKAQVLSVEGISAVASSEYEKYIDQEKKSHLSDGIEKTGT